MTSCDTTTVHLSLLASDPQLLPPTVVDFIAILRVQYLTWVHQPLALLHRTLCPQSRCSRIHPPANFKQLLDIDVVHEIASTGLWDRRPTK